MDATEIETLLLNLLEQGIVVTLKGDKLSVTGSLSQLSLQHKQQLMDYKAKVIDYLKSLQSFGDAEILPRLAGDHYPPSYAQRRLWLINQIESDHGQYNIPTAIEMSGDLEQAALQHALSVLLQRHEILRTCFDEQGNPYLQPAEELLLIHEDLSLLSNDEQMAELKRRLTAEGRKPFDLRMGIMLRAKLYKLSALRHVLLLTLHHIACDGWSIGVLTDELSRLYAAFVAGQDNPLAPPSLQYADFAHWQHQHLDGDKLKQDLDYWLQTLAGVPTVHDLPLCRPRPSKPSHRGGEWLQYFSSDLSESLKAFAVANDATIFMVLNGLFAALLSRFSASLDIVIGTPVANRRQQNLESVVGVFINNLVIRIQLTGQTRVSELLAQSKVRLLGAYQHQQLPFEMLVDRLKPDRNLNHAPLFQVMLSLDNLANGQLTMPGLQLQQLGSDQPVAQYDLALNLVVTSEGISLRWIYAEDIFEKQMIAQLAQSFEVLVAAAIADPDCLVAKLPLMSEIAMIELLRLSRGKECALDASDSIDRRIDRQAAATPLAVALRYDDQSLSYAELESRANRLAAYLMTQGCSAGCRVGLCLERSLDLVVGLLAVLKSGAAYVPLDPAYPLARIEFMIEDASLWGIISQRSVVEGIGLEHHGHLICIDQLQQSAQWASLAVTAPTPSGAPGLAYLIYTSGSTGQPKGVKVAHQQVINFFNGLEQCFGTHTEQEVWLAVTSVSFDISVLELLWTLSRGAQVVIQPEQPMVVGATRSMDLSLFYFAADSTQCKDKYRLLLEGARFADQQGLAGVWVPERHFGDFGGQYPNPSVAAAAVAAVTERVAIRSGSVVLPLHDPIRVAEEWSMVDNLSQGRVSLSLASGWHPNDFVLMPQAYGSRHQDLYQKLDVLKRLWRGESIARENGKGQTINVAIRPKPIQAELPVWITAATSPETFRSAGLLGAHVLTHLLGQDTKQLAEKIEVYRDALAEAGFSRDHGKVALMLHCYVSDDDPNIEATVADPLKQYLRESVNLLLPLAEAAGLDMDQDLDAILEMAFRRYYNQSGLFGNCDQAAARLETLLNIGVDEVACLIDFGIDEQKVLAGLPALAKLQAKSAQNARRNRWLAARLARSTSVTDNIKRFNISHIQCTPSQARGLMAEQAVNGLQVLLLGGEALSDELAGALMQQFKGKLYNLYGPTETTVWSSVCQVTQLPVTLGMPLANEQLLVLDELRQQVPNGVIGELYIGGKGVCDGYWQREELTAERFVELDLGERAGRYYRTGDQVRRLADGRLMYLGRNDEQIKVRGHRIEPGEIEAALCRLDGVDQAVVVARGNPAAVIAYVIVSDLALSANAITATLEGRLPNYMLPHAVVLLETLPLTPNGKVDRRSLPDHREALAVGRDYQPPRNHTEQQLHDLWCEYLDIEQLGIFDNFFSLGGHSLLATRLVSGIRTLFAVNISVKTIFEHQTVATLAVAISSLSRAEQHAVAKAPPNAKVLSFAQRRLWLMDLINPHTSQYNEPMVQQLDGEVDVLVLRQALNSIVVRHEVLRTRYWLAEDGECDFEVLPAYDVALPLEDLSELDEPQRRQQADLSVEAHANQPFDLGSGQLLRAGLLKLSANSHILLINMHHIACDGWSKGILVDELGQLYSALLSGAGNPLPSLAISYRDYAHWQVAEISGDKLAGLRKYWLNQLAGLPVVHQLPLDKTRPAVPDFISNYHFQTLPPSLLKGLHVLAQQHNATLYMVLNTALAALFNRYSGQTDIVFGTPIANREQPELAPLVGCFINTLVIRNTVSTKMTLSELLQQSRQTLLDAYEHQQMPFEMLVDELQPERTVSHTPLFQVLLSLHNNEKGSLELPGLTLKPAMQGHIQGKYDLSLNVNESHDGLRLSWEYATSLFENTTIEQLARHFTLFLEQMVAEPQTSVGDARLLDAVDIARLSAWQHGPQLVPATMTLPQKVVEWSRHHAEATALSQGTLKLSYHRLEQLSRRLAGCLLSMADEAQYIGVVADLDILSTVALLAVMRAGKSYIPIAADLPTKRKSAIIEDSNVGLVLLQTKHNDAVDLGTVDFLYLDDMLCDPHWLAEYEDEDLPHTALTQTAYVLYTSGSTGKPKGALISHANLCNYLQAAASYCSDVVASMVTTSLGFDATVTSLFTPLWCGVEVRLPMPDAQVLDWLAYTLRADDKALLLKLTPAHLVVLTTMLEGVVCKQPHQCVVGGEALSAGVFNRWRQCLPQATIYNEYGPTEATVGCCLWQGASEAVDIVPIGKPMANTRLYVLDQAGRKLPPGVRGELHIAGAGVFDGYLNLPELTEQVCRFDTVVDEDWIYRSGDKVYWRQDGQLCFVERFDSQVKLRGYRIETTEIVALLSGYSGVEAAVVKIDEQRQLLNAWVVGRAEQLSSEQLLQHCRSHLPDYMVPATIMVVAELPLTNNGKVDMACLPQPGVGVKSSGRAAQDNYERELWQIWHQLLGRDDFGCEHRFFEVGGHSLLAIQLISAIERRWQVSLPIRTIFSFPTIADLAAHIRQSLPQQRDVIGKAAPGELLPLSFAQQRLWLVDKIEGHSSHYNVAFALNLQGELNVTLLEEAINGLVKRHEVLRTCYRQTDDGTVYQQILANLDLDLNLLNLNHLPAHQQEIQLQRLAGEEQQVPFDLSEGPVLRATLLALGAQRHVLMLTIHHIAFDGWSTAILTNELSALYQAKLQGHPDPLAPLTIQYGDYAWWQRQWLSGPRLTTKLDYWKAQLHGAPTLHSLPLDRSRPPTPSHRGRVHQHNLPQALSQQVDAFAANANATLFMVLNAAFAALLSRYAGVDDIVIGTPVANREQSEIEGLAGCFINTLALRSNLSDNPDFDTLLERSKQTLLGAYENQQLPFELLVDELNVERSLSHTPIFQVMLSLHNQKSAELLLPGLTITPFERHDTVAQYDLLVNVFGKHQIEMHWEYALDLFDRESVVRMALDFELLLQAVVASPKMPVGQIPLVTSEQLPATVAMEVPDGCVHQWFERQALVAAQQAAIEFDGVVLDYATLNRQANRIAQLLIARQLGIGNRIALCCDPGVEQVVALLGVMKSGAAYVPIDPQFPQERIDYILEDAEVDFVFTQEHLRLDVDFGACPVLPLDSGFAEKLLATCPDTNPKLDCIDDGCSCYILYTSGSTGKPKGVVVAHGELRNYVSYCLDEYAGELRGSVMSSPLTFDATLTALFTPLVSGKTLWVLPRENVLEKLGEYLFSSSDSPCLFKLTPAHLEALAELNRQRAPHGTAHLLVVGGEQFNMATLRHWREHLLPKATYINEYGPTETVVGCSVYRMGPQDDIGVLAICSVVPIGKPIGNTHFHVLNADGCEQPIGVAGELYIGGAGVTRGYLNRPDLTAAAFVEGSELGFPAGRLYRSGDLVRRLPCGNYQYIGRNDSQVKLRGYRIELDAVVATLQSHEQVSRAVVLVQDQTLLAWLVCRDDKNLLEDIRVYLQQKLPGYMLPSIMLPIEALPLTNNGKVDLAALPQVDIAERLARHYVAPQNELQQQLCQLWQEVLSVSKVGINDNFFEIGGHSLLATKLVYEVRARCCFELAVKEVFDHPTIAKMANYLEQTNKVGEYRAIDARHKILGDARDEFDL